MQVNISNKIDILCQNTFYHQMEYIQQNLLIACSIYIIDVTYGGMNAIYVK